MLLAQDDVLYPVDDGDAFDARYVYYDANYVNYDANCEYCDENYGFHDGNYEWADGECDPAQTDRTSRMNPCIVDNDF